jgi:hypothetical protein
MRFSYIHDVFTNFLLFAWQVLEVIVLEARGVPWFEVDPFVTCEAVGKENLLNLILYVFFHLFPIESSGGIEKESGSEDNIVLSTVPLSKCDMNGENGWNEVLLKNSKNEKFSIFSFEIRFSYLEWIIMRKISRSRCGSPSSPNQKTPWYYSDYSCSKDLLTYSVLQAGIMCLGSTLITLPSDVPLDTASYGWYHVTLPLEEDNEGKEMEELLHTLTDKPAPSEGGKISFIVSFNFLTFPQCLYLSASE